MSITFQEEILMNKWIGRISAVVALVSLVGGASLAEAGKKPAGATCPACKMTLSTKKTKDTPVAVPMKGKTLYCCSHCDMGHGKSTGKPKASKHKM